MTRTIALAILLFMAPAGVRAQGVLRLEIHPAERLLHAPARSQQLSIRAFFADGQNRDVTRLTLFCSSDPDTATVDANGLVRFQKPGEVAIQCRYGRAVGFARLTQVRPAPGYRWPDPPEVNLIDRLVFARLKELCLPPSELSNDEMFVRRAYLDACGLLPTVAEVRRFLADKNPDKRRRLIDELIERPEFTELWAHHLGKVLRFENAPIGDKAGMAYLHWIRGYLKNDTGLDHLVREMLLGKGAVTEEGPVHFYRMESEPSAWAEQTARAFLGIRLECVRCHDSTASHWTKEDGRRFTAFFGQLSVQRVDAKPRPIALLILDRKAEWLDPQTKNPVPPRFLDGTMPKLAKEQDRREVLADWVTSPKNPYFARNAANRIWFHLVGKGIADPPDQIHELPFSANDALLDALAKELIGCRFQLKPMVRLIMNSRVYQLSSQPNEINKEDEKHFSRGYPRPLDEAVLLDATAQLMELPPWIEGIDKLPAGTRAVHLPHPGPRFVGGFTRPMPLTVCQRDVDESRGLGAAFLHEINSPHMSARLKAPTNRVNRMLADKRTDQEILDELFLAAFARLPDQKPRQAMREHLAMTKDRAEAWQDCLWAVLNAREFVFRR